MDLLLSRLRDNSATGAVIGERLWGRDQKGKFGKDYGLVVFLVGGLRAIGSRFAEGFFPNGLVNTGIGVGLVDDHVPLSFLRSELNLTYPFIRWRQPSGKPSFEVVPFDIPDEIPISAFASVAHELSHSFNLDDEYAEVGKNEILPEVKVNRVFNLQLHSEVLDGDAISGEKVKWRWPRMKKAGVLESLTVGPTITVVLKAGHTTQFESNEEVRLRHRDLLGTPLADLSSPELKILTKNETTNSLVLQPLSAATFNFATFDPGSLLFLPVKGPEPERNNPTHDKFAEILSPLMRHQINQTHKPQTKFPCIVDTNDRQDPTNLPSLINAPDNHRLIIGLYSGGKGFSCGIYHPSGECIMRKEFAKILEKLKEGTKFKGREIYQFCHVCKYCLVDQIDPRQHDQIDKEYGGIYPTKENLALFIIKRILLVLLIAGVVGVGIYYLKKDD